MKIIKYIITILISAFFLNISVFAASCNLTLSSSNVYVGDSFTVTAKINSAAAWNIHVSATGPVKGCTINQADATSDAMNANKTFKATCTATGTGTITIKLTGDVTSATDGNAVKVSNIKEVKVSVKPITPTKPDNKVIDNRSKNNNLKELKIEGYELKKIDNNNYSLSVPNNVSNVNIIANAEDSKAKVSGTGNHNINIGENNISIIVTAENGKQNKINIKITRKDGYYLEDLDIVLNNDSIVDKNIIINSDTNITNQDLEKIKKSKKNIKFNFYSNEKELIYSWIIDGSKIDNTNDFLTTISNDSENKNNILKLSNYADGIIIKLNQVNNLPSGIKLKLFVGNKYEDGNMVNIYIYSKNDDKLVLTNEKQSIKDGFIEFEISKTDDYFITMSTIINNSEDTPQVDNSLVSKLIIIIFVLSLLIVFLTVILIVKKIKSNNVKNNNEKTLSSEKFPNTTFNSDVNNNISSNIPDNIQNNTTHN